MSIEKILYAATATATGGREGRATSSDNVLDVQLSTPRELGGAGGPGTNPEQLFAAGYAACFGNAVIHATRNKETKISDNDVEVTATVGIGPGATGGFGLTVTLDVTLAGVDQAKAEEIVAEAHKVCPYSNATRGNVDVTLSTHTR